jgi:hypothetical protein
MSFDYSKVSAIVSVDAYSNVYNITKNLKVRALNRLKYDESNFVASFINNRDVITTSIQVSRSIEDELLPSTVDIRAYEELGLDQAKEYNISFVELSSDGENRTLQVFAAEPELIESHYRHVVNETKYADLIVPVPMLYSTLYENEILQSAQVHCFVYFTMYDTFITFYKNGHYIYSKSIEYSLVQIYDKYCELVGEPVNEDEFFKILSSEGLKAVDDTYQRNLMKLFSDIFIAVNDIMIYVKRAYNVDVVSQVYVGSSIGEIVGLDEYGENYLGVKTHAMNFDYGLHSEEWYTDQLQQMLILLSIEYMKDELAIPNFSPFSRPPEFYKRDSGQFIIAVFIVSTLALSGPLYYILSSYLNDTTNVFLRSENQELLQEANKYRQILEQKSNQIKALDKQIGQITQSYNAKEQTLVSIFDKKVSYRMKSDMLSKIAKDLKQFDVSISGVQTQGDEFLLSLVSKDEKRITALIKHISEKYFDEIELIDFEKIEKQNEDEFYLGVLKVVLQ